MSAGGKISNDSIKYGGVLYGRGVSTVLFVPMHKVTGVIFELECIDLESD